MCRSPGLGCIVAMLTKKTRNSTLFGVMGVEEGDAISNLV